MDLIELATVGSIKGSKKIDKLNIGITFFEVQSEEVRRPGQLMALAFVQGPWKKDRQYSDELDLGIFPMCH